MEDDEIAERMDAGRRALLLRGDNEAGPYQSPMEDGMQQFHEWYRAQKGLQGVNDPPGAASRCSSSLLLEIFNSLELCCTMRPFGGAWQATYSCGRKP